MARHQRPGRRDIYYKGTRPSRRPSRPRSPTGSTARRSRPTTYWQERACDPLRLKHQQRESPDRSQRRAAHDVHPSWPPRLILDNSNFKNVTTVNGKIANDGDRTIWWPASRCPACRRTRHLLTATSTSRPTSEIEADATDFSLDTSLTAVSSKPSTSTPMT